MLLDWFNAREATQAGLVLADHFLPAGAPDLQRFLQRAIRDTTPLKLNLFKRAKLLNAFKWRLLERGVDPHTVDQVTELLLVQLSGRVPGAAAPSEPGSVGAGASSRRVPALLAEADARLADGEIAAAAARYEKALEIEPRNAVAHNRLGIAYLLQGKYPQAEAEFRAATELKPTYAEAHFRLGTVLRWRGNFSASETALRRAIKLDPRNEEALVGLGHALSGLGSWDQGKSCMQKALRLKPRSTSALCALGWVAGIEGRFEEAERLLRQAVAADPKSAEAWAALARLRRMTPEDKEWLAGVEPLLAAGVPPIEEAKLRFALGKYFDDLSNYSRAFKEYSTANELHKGIALPYDRPARTRFVDAMVGTYTRELLATRAKGASDSAKPVFVVGMMRSGTSLMEQIIASHPDAAGAGELDFWNSMVHREKPFLQGAAPDAHLTRKLAESYLRILDRRSPQALRVSDKAPFNSGLVGLIHRVLPNARFIYMRRDPLDACLSCYFQDFANMAPFTLDLADLAHYYRGHHRLLEHWRAALPPGTLLEVPYAELVAEQETWSRRVLEFIGLPWDPRCLQFHETERPVVTASTWQVRQPVFARSLQRWRNYEKHIGPLLELRELERS